MKIGAIGYSNASGLGVMLKFFRENLPINSQLVISWEAKGMNLKDLECPFVITPKENSSIDSLEAFIQFNPDLVLIIEYPFNWKYLQILKEKGIKVVYIPMLDSIGLSILEKYKDFVGLWLCINKWSYELVKSKGWKCCYLPYPIDTDYFKFQQRGYGKVLLHNAGYVGLKNRKGTDIVLKAFQEIRKNIDIRLIINSQVPLEKYGDLSSVDVRIGEKIEINDIYSEGDIYLAPSRFEGYGLAMSEAMACGFPVITTDAPPMNELVTTKELLVKVKGSFGNIYEPDVDDLVSKIQFAISNDLSNVAKENRKIIEEKFSWNVLKPKYLEVLQKVCNGEL